MSVEMMSEAKEMTIFDLPLLTLTLHGLIKRPARMTWRTELGLVRFLRRQLSVRIKKGFCVQGAGCNCCAVDWR